MAGSHWNAVSVSTVKLSLALLQMELDVMDASLEVTPLYLFGAEPDQFLHTHLPQGRRLNFTPLTLHAGGSSCLRTDQIP